MNTLANLGLWAIYIVALYFTIFWYIVLITKGVKHDLPKISRYPNVTITIPAYNEQENIQPTIESVLKMNYPRDKLEIIVVNDGSKDSTAKIVEKLIKQNPQFDIKLINQENIGKGGAINKGLKIAKGEFFVVLDADSYPEKDALIKLLPHFDKDDVEVVLPSMKVWKPKNMLQKIQALEYIVNMFFKRIMCRLNCVAVIPGPFSVYRTKTLRNIGGFEKRNLTEDYEITLRFHSKHHKILQLLDPVVYTKTPATTKALYKQRNRWFKGTVLNVFRYRWMVFNREYGDYGMIQIPMTMITGIIALGLFATFSYHLFHPYIEFIKNLFLINFDIMTLIKNFKFDFNIFDFNFSLMLFTIFMTLVSMTIVYLAHRKQKEKMLKHGIIPFVLFVSIYYATMGIVWIGVILELIFGKRQVW